MKKLAVMVACTAILLLSFIDLPAASTAFPAPAATPAAPSPAATGPDSATHAVIDQSLREFKSLSRKEKRNRFKDVKKLIRQYKSDLQDGQAQESDKNLILLAILAILLPPLAIYLKESNFTWKFWLSLALLVIGIIFFSSLAFLWLLSAALALLVVFDIL